MERRMVTVQQNIYYEDGYSVKDFCELLKRHEKLFKQKYPDLKDINLQMHIAEEYAEFYLQGETPESNEDFKKRLAHENKMKEMRRQQYENLKKEFEK